MAADPAAVRRAAHDILGRPEFSSVHPSLVERARTAVGHFFGQLLSGTLSGIGPLGVAVLALVVAVIALAIVVAARNVSRDPRLTGVTVGVAGRAPADWEAEAQACERRGDFRGALRARYRSLVAELAHRGLVEEIPGRTAGEYRRAVAVAAPPAAGGFGEATDLFEGAVYGHGEVGPPESARIGALAGEVLAATR